MASFTGLCLARIFGALRGNFWRDSPELAVTKKFPVPFLISLFYSARPQPVLLASRGGE